MAKAALIQLTRIKILIALHRTLNQNLRSLPMVLWVNLLVSIWIETYLAFWNPLYNICYPSANYPSKSPTGSLTPQTTNLDSRPKTHPPTDAQPSSAQKQKRTVEQGDNSVQRKNRWDLSSHTDIDFHSQLGILTDYCEKWKVMKNLFFPSMLKLLEKFMTAAHFRPLHKMREKVERNKSISYGLNWCDLLIVEMFLLKATCNELISRQVSTDKLEKFLGRPRK